MEQNPEKAKMEAMYLERLLPILFKTLLAESTLRGLRPSNPTEDDNNRYAAMMLGVEMAVRAVICSDIEALTETGITHADGLSGITSLDLQERRSAMTVFATIQVYNLICPILGEALAEAMAETGGE